MHPIERLRYLARLDPSRVDVIALEAAETLLASAAEPAELVVACRRLLDRHPAAGPLWWVASCALTATDPQMALLDVAQHLANDATPLMLETELAVRPDAVALAAWSFGPDGVFATPADVADAEEAHMAGQAVLVAGGPGRGLPPVVWRAAMAGVERLHGRRPALLGWDVVDAVVGPNGAMHPTEAVAGATCPIANELLGRSRP